MAGARVQGGVGVAHALASAACAWALTSCAGVQSALEPAGRDAERIADLFWGMTIGAVIIWLGFVALMIYSGYFARREYTVKAATLLVIGGGIVFPTFVLTGLLSYSLTLLPSFLDPAPEGSLKILVTGEQWWWRVRYYRADGQAVDVANEIRIPVGAPVEFELESPDVIHSFWIPSLGGKMDMIPGRKTRLRLEPTKAGIFRGVCAEYCGTSHALMAFWVVVEEKEKFDQWLDEQAKPASSSEGSSANVGRESFLANGCGACHTVRGTAADGVVGPDLTHAGSRLSVGAGVLANNADSFRHWIAHTNDKKPGVRMPAFGMLPPDQLQALAVYLESLK
jgi:cytochrome c oxidase subunit II